MQQTSNEFNPVIIVMAKVPRPGEVKTRLRPFLTGEQCAALAACFLKDTAANAAEISPNVIVAFSPPEHRTEIESLLPDETVFIEQHGSDCGGSGDRQIKTVAGQFRFDGTAQRATIFLPHENAEDDQAERRARPSEKLFSVHYNFPLEYKSMLSPRGRFGRKRAAVKEEQQPQIDIN